MGEDLAPVIVMISGCILIGWIVWVVVEGRRRRERLKAVTEFHQRLLDKIGSTSELGEFLQTDGGTRFLDSLSVEPSRPNDRILRSIQIGIVLGVLGLGFLLLGWIYGFRMYPFYILGTLLLALGVGFCLSSGVSYRLARTWGLIGAGYADGASVDREKTA